MINNQHILSRLKLRDIGHIYLSIYLYICIYIYIYIYIKLKNNKHHYLPFINTITLFEERFQPTDFA